MACPSAEDLLIFTQGGQSDAKARQIARHLVTCKACDRAVDEILAEEQPTLYEVVPAGYEITAEEATLGLAAIKLMMGGHLTAELMIAYSDETLGEVDARLVREHLVACRQCADALLAYADSGARSWNRFMARFGGYLFGEDWTPVKRVARQRGQQLVAGHVVIANTAPLWQTWQKYQPEALPDGWQVWWLSAQHGLQTSSQNPDHIALQNSQVHELAERVARQWNGNIASSVVMAGGWPYQEVAIRARLNVVKRIDGRHMRRKLKSWAEGWGDET